MLFDNEVRLGGRGGMEGTLSEVGGGEWKLAGAPSLLVMIPARRRGCDRKREGVGVGVCVGRR